MSKRKTVTITCPQCGEEHPFTRWLSINTTLNPEMKEKVRDLSAFLFTCPSCGHISNVAYDFLYHQMEDGIKIFCSVTDEDYEYNLKMLTEADPFKDIDDDDPLKKLFSKYGKEMFNTDNTRIVRNQNDFLEKLYIFDDELDDRIIEFLKLMVLARFLDDSLESYENIDIFYTPSEDNDINFEIYADGEIKSRMAFPKEAYAGFKSLYSNYLPNIEVDSFEIDRDWAVATMEKINQFQDELISGMAED